MEPMGNSLAKDFDKLDISEKTKCGYVFDERMVLHKQEFGDHPEQPSRILAIYFHLLQKDFIDKMIYVPVERATNEELLLVHDQKHIEKVKTVSEELEDF